MNLIRITLLSLILSSCGNNSSDVKVSAIDSSQVTDTSFTTFANPDSSYEIVNARGYYVWEVNAEKKTLKKNTSLTAAAANIDSVISGLNKQYEDILLEKTGIKNDTLQLRIKDSDYFTNQMGSSGPEQYLAQAVINLTSIPGIKYVQIDFKEGNHASPGTWERKDYPGYIIVQ